MRLLALFAVLIPLLSFAPAQAQTAPPALYGKLWFFNKTGRPVRLVFADGRPDFEIPDGRIGTPRIPDGSFHFVVKTEGMEDLTENHFFDKGSSFADVKDDHWVCMILEVPRGEYIRPDLERLDWSKCAYLLEQR